MRRSNKRQAKPIPCRAHDDLHDEIARDVLEIWISVSRLLQKVSNDMPQGWPGQTPPPNKRPSRRQAA